MYSSEFCNSVLQRTFELSNVILLNVMSVSNAGRVGVWNGDTYARACAIYVTNGQQPTQRAAIREAGLHNFSSGAVRTKRKTLFGCNRLLSAVQRDRTSPR